MNLYFATQSNTMTNAVSYATLNDAHEQLKGLQVVKVSLRRGYIPRRSQVVMDYNGRYGKGKVLALPADKPNGKPQTNYCYVVYYIKEED